MRTHFHFPKAHSGSALIIVLFTVVLLGALSGAVLLNVLNKRATLNSSASWQESLVAAEAGAHRAVAQVAQALSFCTADSLANLPSGVQSFTVTLNHHSDFPELWECSGADLLSHCFNRDYADCRQKHPSERFPRYRPAKAPAFFGQRKRVAKNRSDTAAGLQYRRGHPN